MRPIATVLNFAFDYLYYNGFDSRGKERYICRALDDALADEVITAAEATAAREVVMAAVIEMAPNERFLIDAARKNGLVDNFAGVYNEEYIEFRDKWLRDLIAQQEVPK